MHGVRHQELGRTGNWTELCRDHSPQRGHGHDAVPLTLQLSKGATLDETEPCIVSIDGMSLVVDLTVSDPCITVQNEGYTRTYCLRLKEAME